MKEINEVCFVWQCDPYSLTSHLIFWARQRCRPLWRLSPTLELIQTPEVRFQIDDNFISRWVLFTEVLNYGYAFHIIRHVALKSALWKNNDGCISACHSIQLLFQTIFYMIKKVLVMSVVIICTLNACYGSVTIIVFTVKYLR